MDQSPDGRRWFVPGLMLTPTFNPLGRLNVMEEVNIYTPRHKGYNDFYTSGSLSYAGASVPRLSLLVLIIGSFKTTY